MHKLEVFGDEKEIELKIKQTTSKTMVVFCFLTPKKSKSDETEKNMEKQSLYRREIKECRKFSDRLFFPSSYEEKKQKKKFWCIIETRGRKRTPEHLRKYPCPPKEPKKRIKKKNERDYLYRMDSEQCIVQTKR